MQVLLVIVGAATLLVGVRLAVRVHRWAPHVSPDLTDYQPGPDVFDWARAVAPILVGGALLLAAVAL